MKQVISLRVNGINEEVLVEPWWSLADVLREQLNLIGTKIGCNEGNCGSCTVLINGKAIKSCLLPVLKARGKEILTIEGLGKDKLHPIQQAFIDHFAIQCGFCTPGMILATKALLDEQPDATEEEIKMAMSGNLCRCTGYVKILEAIQAVQKLYPAEKES